MRNSFLLYWRLIGLPKAVAQYEGDIWNVLKAIGEAFCSKGIMAREVLSRPTYRTRDTGLLG